MNTLNVMMLRPISSNWLMRLLSIEDQVSLAIEQNSSLIQYRLVSRENFRARASFNEVNGIPKLIEKDQWRNSICKSLINFL